MIIELLLIAITVMFASLCYRLTWPNIRATLRTFNGGAISLNPVVSKSASPCWIKINDNMKLTQSDSPYRISCGRTLAVLMTWLGAQDRHTEKFVQLHTTRGFDVLLVKLRPGQLLLPPLGSQRVCAKLLKFLESNQENYDNYIYHCFSVGAYLNSELLHQFRVQPERYATIMRLSRATIYDSIVDPDFTPYSFGKAMTTSSTLATLIGIALRCYLIATYPFTLRHYQNAADSFLHTPIRKPVLIFGSKTDKLTNLDIVSRIQSTYQSHAIKVCVRIWPDTEHVGHFRRYPHHYEAELHRFLTSNNLIYD